MKQPIVQPPVLPADAFFFIIPIENDDMILTKEVIYKYYDPSPKTRRLPSRLFVKTMGFNRELFTVEVDLWIEPKHYLFIHTGRSELRVACDCGMPGTRLCRHAYYGILQLMHYRDLDLRRYYWPGLTEEVKGRSRYLEVDSSGYEFSIRPKEQYGNIYKAGLGFDGTQNLTFEKQGPGGGNLPKGNQPILGFALMYMPSGYHKTHLPYLMPFTATTDKKGADIAGYQHYLRKDKPYRYSRPLTHDQVMLSEISNDMFTLARSAGSPDSQGQPERWQQAAAILLSLWKRVIPKLHNELYFRACFSYGFGNWTDKPRKTDLSECAVSAGNLSISFLLKDRPNYFTLEYMITVNGRDITASVRKDPLFIYNQVSKHYYLVSSMQDENLLNFFATSRNRLTILKAHSSIFTSGSWSGWRSVTRSFIQGKRQKSKCLLNWRR